MAPRGDAIAQMDTTCVAKRGAVETGVAPRAACQRPPQTQKFIRIFHAPHLAEEVALLAGLDLLLGRHFPHIDDLDHVLLVGRALLDQDRLAIGAGERDTGTQPTGDQRKRGRVR